MVRTMIIMALAAGMMPHLAGQEPAGELVLDLQGAVSHAIS
jgi:hypothetical protein